MTDDKQDPSVVAWRSRWRGDIGWHFASKPRLIRGDDAEDFIQEPLSLTSDLTAMKAELEEAKKATERMWCLSCGTVTRDGQCDCTRLDMDCQNLVNYADAMAGDREAAAKEINAILARAEAAEQERDELREALSDTLEPGGLINAAAENLRSADRDERRVEAAFRIAYQLDELRRRVAALSKPKPHDETRGRG